MLFCCEVNAFSTVGKHTAIGCVRQHGVVKILVQFAVSPLFTFVASSGGNIPPCANRLAVQFTGLDTGLWTIATHVCAQNRPRVCVPRPKFPVTTDLFGNGRRVLANVSRNRRFGRIVFYSCLYHLPFVQGQMGIIVHWFASHCLPPCGGTPTLSTVDLKLATPNGHTRTPCNTHFHPVPLTLELTIAIHPLTPLKNIRD